MNDFSKFVCFVKGTLITAEVVRNAEKTNGLELKREMRMHFNRILNNCASFEKEVQRDLGPKIAECEDEINSSIVGLVWAFFDLPYQERSRFIDHINKFEFEVLKNSEDVSDRTEAGTLG